MNIIVYTKDQCANCIAAKMLLDAKKLEFIERNVEEEQWKDVFTRQYPELRQMPQIFIEGQRVGGFAGLQGALTELGL